MFRPLGSDSFIHGSTVMSANPGTVDGDFDLHFPEGPPEDLAFHPRIRLDVEDVFTVRREVVDHRDAAARSEGGPPTRSFCDAVRGSRYRVELGSASGSPNAIRLRWLAARR